MPALDTDDLAQTLNLRNGRRSSMLKLVEAIDGPPELTLTMDGACVLTVVVADADRKLVTSPLIRERSFSSVDGIPFELAAISKTGDRITLTYEDGISSALRRRKSKMVIPAGTMTRAAIAQRLAKEAKVPVLVDQEKRRKVAAAVKRSVGKGETSSSWDVLRQLADDIRWRCFTDGRRLYVGGDDWLMDRLKPVRLRENTGPVGSIDWDLDTGKRASSASLDIDANMFSLVPGTPVQLAAECGPAQGRWLVQEFTRPLTSTRARVTLTRAKHELEEPKAAKKGDRGEPDNLPGQGGSNGGAPASGAREKMVQVALAQDGKPYVWGGKGPGSFDCSGLVQYATAAAGKTLGAPSASQAAAVASAGRGMSIDAAIRTRGALLFRMGSPYNHVAISLGNGSTIEAMGTAYGVCIGNASGRGWTSAGTWI